ncbi:MAG TPA: 50S ribosomal protein L18 [Candidatus Saccharimonadia bacterium]|jgi:large subunit ribosomal protein L18|nr:50S ribosomal protein L18 [Candidatus Saccharimonadia bacterium]
MLDKQNRRRGRVRATVSGTPERPRLSVKITLVHISAQIIDDTKGLTLAQATTVKSDAKGSMTEKAVWVGEKIAEAAKAKKIKKVVFDRNGRIYHGRLHALADAARNAGLEF